MARGLAVDDDGNAYVVGLTNSGDFPTTAGSLTPGGSDEVFVTKLNAAGSAFVYSTYLGGSGTDDGRGLGIDAAGNAYVTGFSSSGNFPTTTGAFDLSANGSFDVFVTKLDLIAGTPVCD